MNKFTEEELNILEDCLFCEVSDQWHKRHHDIKNKIWRKALANRLGGSRE